MTQGQSGLTDRFAEAPSPVGGSTQLKRGRIIAVNPAQRSADVVLKTGGILRGVPVLVPIAGTHEGSTYMPAVTAPVDNPSFAPTGDHDTFCIVGYVDGDQRKPCIIGLQFPDQTEVSFADKEVDKHGNGSYTAWDSDGFEIDRPDGTYIRIGASTTKLPLAGQNFDSASQPFSETAGSSSTVPHIYIKHSSGLTIDITPAGSIVITKAGGGSFALESHTHSDPQGGSTGGPQ